jgi:hypothetical protein
MLGGSFVTTAWRVLRLRMEETAYRYGGYLRIYWSVSRPGRFAPGERAPGTHWIGGWVDPRAGLDDLADRKFMTLPGLELRPLRWPARSQLLYRLSYPDS